MQALLQVNVVSKLMFLMIHDCSCYLICLRRKKPEVVSLGLCYCPRSSCFQLTLKMWHTNVVFYYGLIEYNVSGFTRPTTSK